MPFPQLAVATPSAALFRVMALIVLVCLLTSSSAVAAPLALTDASSTSTSVLKRSLGSTIWNAFCGCVNSLADDFDPNQNA